MAVGIAEARGEALREEVAPVHVAIHPSERDPSTNSNRLGVSERVTLEIEPAVDHVLAVEHLV